jgi:hypothetical protein
MEPEPNRTHTQSILCLTQAPLPAAPGPLPEERTSPYWVAKPFGAVEARYRFYVQSFQELTRVLLSLNVYTGGF